MLGVIDAIQATVNASGYETEIDFQVDLFYALAQAFDGHLYYQSDILRGVFAFGLHFEGLSSVSTDGLSDPEIYFTSDLVDIGIDNIVLNDNVASPVTKLNGVDVVEALQTLGLLLNSQDPDSRYNQQFFSLGRTSSITGNAGTLLVPPSATSYEFQFANGSKVEVPIIAIVSQNFDGVTDGDTAYQSFAPFADFLDDTATVTSAAATESATATQEPSVTQTSSEASEPTSLPTIPYFPYPVVKDDSDLIAGYYLNDTGYEDVAVLQITGFEPQTENDYYITQFPAVLSDFLASATSDGKKKLIIDLQGNGGGVIDLGTDLFVQLFPNLHPNVKTNMRRTLGMDIIISSAAAEVDAVDANATIGDIEAYNNQPFAYQYDVDPNNDNIDSVQQLLDGITVDGTEFTTFFQTNYSDPIASEITGFEITQTDPAATPPFAPENIIVLTDGYCASTCTVISEHLKNQAGVQFIVVGGRPQHGPVQAIGGIKGNQVFSYANILQMIGIFDNATDSELASTQGTEWENFDNGYPFARTAAAALSADWTAGASAAAGGVNGRNGFRIGDDSNTPLQYVYEAADCRLYFTPEMLYDPVFLWNRVADVAFKNRTGLKYDSPYCVAGSTGHPTSISGGWKQGTLGPQDQGKVEASSPIFQNAPWNPSTNGSDFDWSVVTDAETFGSSCTGYNGDKWLVKVVCNLYNGLSSS